MKFIFRKLLKLIFGRVFNSAILDVCFAVLNILLLIFVFLLVKGKSFRVTELGGDFYGNEDRVSISVIIFRGASDVRKYFLDQIGGCLYNCENFESI